MPGRIGYLVVRRRDADMRPTETVYAACVMDDIGVEYKFALAMHAASLKLQETYPFGGFHIHDSASVPDCVELVTYRASEFLTKAD